MELCKYSLILFILNLLFITQRRHHAVPPWFTLTAPLVNLGPLGQSVRRAAALWTWLVLVQHRHSNTNTQIIWDNQEKHTHPCLYVYVRAPARLQEAELHISWNLVLICLLKSSLTFA